MKLELRYPVFLRVKTMSERLGIPPGDLVEMWVVDRLDRENVPLVAPVAGCLAPRCGKVGFNRGLCPPHYARARYLRSMSQGDLTEGFMVHRGRMAPRKGLTVSSYPGEGPRGNPPSSDAVTLWFYGRSITPEETRS